MFVEGGASRVDAAQAGYPVFVVGFQCLKLSFLVVFVFFGVVEEPGFPGFEVVFAESVGYGEKPACGSKVGVEGGVAVVTGFG